MLATRDLPVDGGLAGLVEDADIHAAAMQVDPAVVVVLLCVESHTRPPFEVGFVVPNSIPRGCAGRGASTSVHSLERTAGSS